MNAGQFAEGIITPICMLFSQSSLAALGIISSMFGTYMYYNRKLIILSVKTSKCMLSVSIYIIPRNGDFYSIP